MIANEASLIQRSQAGELEAFNQLLRRYQRLAYALALQTLQDPEAAADAVQDAFLRAYLAIHTLQGPCFKRWLLRILVNRCYDILRVWRRRATVSLDDLLAVEAQGKTIWDGAESVEEYVERLELRQWIEAGIYQLPTEQRLLVMLADLQGYGYADLAEFTGVPVGTIKSRLSRGRGKLRDFLGQQRSLLPASYQAIAPHGAVVADCGGTGCHQHLT
jgi:RNA polymerase sigma-70 factor, ECF subfamily